MVVCYNRVRMEFVITYNGYKVTIQFQALNFTKVMGIPSMRYFVGKLKKIDVEKRELHIQRVCRQNLTPKGLQSIQSLCRHKFLKKHFLTNVKWRCKLDLLKCRLMGTSCASDIAFWMVEYMLKINVGRM